MTPLETWLLNEFLKIKLRQQKPIAGGTQYKAEDYDFARGRVCRDLPPELITAEIVKWRNNYE